MTDLESAHQEDSRAVINYEELKEIFQVKARMYFQEDNEKRNWTSSVAN